MRFVIVGLISNGVLLALFVVLSYAGAAGAVAALIVYAVGLTGSYVANRAWSFGSARRHQVAVKRYLVAHSIGATFQVSVQCIFHEILGFSAVLVQIGGMAVLVIILFLLFEYYVFSDVRLANMQ